jgi:hypothetical protein
MIRYTRHILLAFVATAAATCAFAQATPPSEDKTAPQAASSPHQRNTTKEGANEAAANQETDPSSSSSQHQRQTTEASAKGTTAQREQMMNDCMSKQQKADSSVTKDQAKRTCMDQMKKAETPAG